VAQKKLARMPMFVNDVEFKVAHTRVCDEAMTWKIVGFSYELYSGGYRLADDDGDGGIRIRM